MREHDPLGNPRGAAAVGECGHIVHADLMGGWRLTMRHQSREGSRTLRCTEHHDLTHGACVLRRRLALRQQIGDGHQKDRPAVGKLGPDLLGRSDRIHGGTDGPDRYGGIENDRELRQVGAHQPHDVPRPDPMRHQPGRHATDRRLERTVAVAAARGPADDGGTVGELRGPFEHERDERLLRNGDLGVGTANDAGLSHGSLPNE